VTFPDTAPGLNCRSATFTFPDAEGAILLGVDFGLAPGDFCVLLGQNGSGKSTLCRLLSGLYLPSDGVVTVDGIDTASAAAGASLPRLVQYVAHDAESQVIGETVEDDVALGLRNFGYREALEQRVDLALAAFGISQLRGRSVQHLSGGELQLVRLAGALAVAPRYLILDEALAMLEPLAHRRAMEAIKQLQADRSLAVLLATHELGDVAWANRVVWLDSGRLVLDAPADRGLEALIVHPDAPFDLPAIVATAHRLREVGWSIPLVFEPEQLVEALCASSS
jgi:energy-coupling factor transport system ATP-binding protein